jgi:uncharacterized membrane protein YfcA
MTLSLSLALIAFTGYFFESVFGFGGTVIFLGLAGIFFDFKSMVQVSMVVSATCSAAILVQTWRHFNRRHFLKVMAIALPFVIIGTALMGILQSLWLLKVFALLLIAYGIQGLFFPAFAPPRKVSYLFVALGGVIQGVFTTGGPFILMGYRRFFADKTELKATMAGFFLASNLCRMGQIVWEGNATMPQLASSLWLAVPVAVAVVAGHFVHLRLSERIFQQGLLAAMTAVGMLLMFK